MSQIVSRKLSLLYKVCGGTYGTATPYFISLLADKDKFAKYVSNLKTGSESIIYWLFVTYTPGLETDGYSLSSTRYLNRHNRPLPPYPDPTLFQEVYPAQKPTVHYRGEKYFRLIGLIRPVKTKVEEVLEDVIQETFHSGIEQEVKEYASYLLTNIQRVMQPYKAHTIYRFIPYNLTDKIIREDAEVDRENQLDEEETQKRISHWWVSEGKREMELRLLEDRKRDRGKREHPGSFTMVEVWADPDNIYNHHAEGVWYVQDYPLLRSWIENELNRFVQTDLQAVEIPLEVEIEEIAIFPID